MTADAHLWQPITTSSTYQPVTVDSAWESLYASLRREGWKVTHLGGVSVSTNVQRITLTIERESQ